MKVVVTVEPGFVRIETDTASAPVIIANPENAEKAQVSVFKSQKYAKNGTKMAQKDEKKPKVVNTGSCVQCGKSLEGRHPAVKLCSELCRNRWKSEYMKRYFAARKMEPLPGQESLDDAKPVEDVSYCKHCSAWGTHATKDHVFEMPASTAPAGLPSEVKAVKQSASKPSPSFDDPWNCEGCRIIMQTCNFHKTMEKHGKRPPTYRLEIGE